MKNTPKDIIDVLIPPKDELDSEEVNTDALQNKDDVQNEHMKNREYLLEKQGVKYEEYS